MKIIVNEIEYTDIKNLSFSPQVSLSNDSLPINEFSADILAIAPNPHDFPKPVRFAGWAELRSDDGRLWAKYWVRDTVQGESYIDAYTARLVARDMVSILDVNNLPEIVYDEEPISNVLDATMVWDSGERTGLIVPMSYTLDSALSDVTISGYFPAQTARERLKWICFVAGAYVQTAFVEEISIKKLKDGEDLYDIPSDKVFWEPVIGYKDEVNNIKASAYTFTQSLDAAEDSGSFTFPEPWVATKSDYWYTSPYITGGDPPNVVEFNELYVINEDNVQDVMDRLVFQYMVNETVTFDAINDGEYQPGDYVGVRVRDQSGWTVHYGMVESASFRFGKNHARATMKLVSARH